MDDRITCATHPSLFQVGDKVNFFSRAGPCLPATLVKVNRKTVTVNFYGNISREPTWSVHKPGTCISCHDDHSL